MFCEKCGTKNADDARFCENCGNPLSKIEAENSVSTVNPAEAENAPEAENSVSTANPAEAENAPEAENSVSTVNPAEAENAPVVENSVDTTPQAGAAQAGFDAAGNPVPVQKKKAPVKLIAGLCAGAVALIVAIIAIVLVVVNSKPTINLNDYIKVKTDGYDGYGSASISIDWDAIDEEYGSKLKFTGDAKDKYGDLLDLAEPIDALKSNIKVEFNSDSKTTELKNGDKVKYKITVNKDAQKFVKCKLEYKNSEYTVSGLKAVETFDAFEGVTVEFSGRSGSGYADFNFDGAKLGRYDFTISQIYDLKNGDVITVELYNKQAQDYIDNYGMVPEAFEKEFKVEGLEEIITSSSAITSEGLEQLKKEAEAAIKKTLDIQLDSSVSYDGLQYEGYIFASNDSSNVVYVIYSADVSSEDNKFNTKKVYYPVCIKDVFETEDEYKYSSDTSVTGYSGLDIDNYFRTPGYTSLLSCYLDLVKFDTSYEKHEIVDLSEKFDSIEMITKLADIDDTDAKDIIADAKTRIEEYVKGYYDEENSVSDLKAAGQYFVYNDKADDDDEYKNAYIVVYSGKLSNSKSEFKATTVYFPVIYNGMYSVDGKLMVADYNGIIGDTSLDGGYSTKGYTDGKEMYDSMVDNLNSDYKWEMTKGLEKFKK